MRTKQSVLAIALLVVAALTFWASATTSSVPLKTPVYTWSPPTEERKPIKFTIAILNPSYVENYAGHPLMMYEPFKSFSGSLAADIEEALTARGYSIRGPFKSRDEMVYNDKEVSDLALIIEIAPMFRMVSGKFDIPLYAVVKCSDGSYPTNLVNAVISISGKINLTAMEPLSGEKLWVKSVEIPLTQTYPVTSGLVCGARDQVLQYIISDNTVQNAIVALLENGYKDIIDKIWNHIHPSEFERLATTIRDLKKGRK